MCARVSHVFAERKCTSVVCRKYLLHLRLSPVQLELYSAVAKNSLKAKREDGDSSMNITPYVTLRNMRHMRLRAGV